MKMHRLQGILFWTGFLLFAVTGFVMQAQRSGEAAAPTPEMEVVHHVRGNHLYLEFILTHFQLNRERMGQEPVYGEGHIHLYIDGQKVAKIFQPAYVHKDLAPGRHQVKVELAHHNHESYGITEEFAIEVKESPKQTFQQN